MFNPSIVGIFLNGRSVSSSEVVLLCLFCCYCYDVGNIADFSPPFSVWRFFPRFFLLSHTVVEFLVNILIFTRNYAADRF